MRFLTFALVLTACCSPVAAEEWTVDDILLAERASGFEVSRDGKLVVWVVSAMDKEKGESVSQIHLRNLAGDYSLQLTRGKDSSSSPKFSPDGQKLAFLSSRGDSSGSDDKKDDGKTDQIWILDTRGGEPRKLTDFKKGVKAAAWLDNENLLITATEDPSLYEQRNKERKDTSKVVDDEEHAPPVRLFRFALADKKAERLTTNNDRIEKTYVSGDGAFAVTIHERSLAYEYNQKVRPVTFLHDLKAGTSKQLFTDGRLMPQRVVFALGGKGFYFSAPYSTHPTYTFGADSKLYYYDLAGGQVTEVNLDWDRHLGGDFEAAPGGVVALLSNGARFKAARFTKAGEGWTRSWIDSQHAPNIFGLALSRDGKTLVYEYSTASTPPQWYAAQLGGSAILDAKVITTLNQGFEKKTKSRTEIVKWTGAKDEEVEGILYYPLNYEAGKKYPLVLSIHGGPHGADMDEWSESSGYPNHILAQRGAFILKPNYHGSSDYGLAWGESISGGNYNDLEWIDCDRGVDAMIERGLADPEQLGVMGWSNGSIITIELTTRVTRYKVASAGAGDVNWLSDWANCQFGDSFDQYYLGTTPLEDPDFYVKKSPLFRMDKVVTPTIIYFGTVDRQVPTEQGWQHFRALQHLGKTDTKFILFPGEAHGPRKYWHQRRKLVEDLAWFDKYLFKPGTVIDESLKPGSPLAAALKLKAAGETPETVARGAIRIGRFEVTRAQFAAFRSAFSYPAGTGEYPANNVTFEDAKAYCDWLAKKTGRKFRLGTEKELDKYLKASEKENTLDAWAGYTVNPDDAEKLDAKVRSLGSGALLKPVGSYAGEGDDPAFDLGGNVAEWAVAEGETGKPLGGSADRPADAKSNGKPAPDYTGFRVVEDLP